MKVRNLIILLLLTSVTLLAQEKSNSYYGFKIGSQITTDTRDYAQITEQFDSNLQLGIFARFGRKIFFQPEAYYHNYKLSNNTSIKYFKAPLMLGLRLINLGIITAHVNTGPIYSKQLGSQNQGGFNWQIGLGGDVLGIFTTDFRYTLPADKNVNNAIEDLIANGGMLNFTVGIKLR